jgi:hypothetical protein
MAHEVQCCQHGRQGIALACIHVAKAIDSGEKVGFFWGDDVDTARPDAWCYACEQALLKVPKDHATDQWFLACDFKILCARCWDLAKERMCGPS